MRRGSAPRKLRALVIGCVVLALAALSGAGTALADTPEDRLSAVFQAIESNRLDTAMQRVETLIRDHPNFRLAHLVRGDLLLARSQPLQTFGNVAKTVPPEKIAGLRAEAMARLDAQKRRPADDRVPSLVLQLHSEQKYALVVDSRASRLYVFANSEGRARLVADYYVTLGKAGVEKTREGDKKTPIGVYHVTANLPRSKLTDFYGAGAFPINYPNEWDRRLGRNGHGIWLHGTPSEVYSRPPRASDGCLVLANPDIEAVASYLQVGLTPVIIADEIEWSDAASVEAERKGLAAAFEQWRSDWASRDTERFLSHYSPRFKSGAEDLAAFGAQKRAVNSVKKWVAVKTTQVSMFRYPRERDFVVVTFEQDYRSSNFSNVMRKRQYWVKEAGAWKIIYEGKA